MILVIAAAVVAAAYCAWCWVHRVRLAKRAEHSLPNELTEIVVPGQPALLYFTTPDCVQCRMRQTPILNQFRNAADVTVHTLDAIQHDGLARFFGIMTVPTTIWLDARLQPVAVNHGVATLDQLRSQHSQTISN
jgi:thioredoxin-like negative regulator of GroEL